MKNINKSIERDVLIDKIVSFCFDYGIFEVQENESEIKSNIGIGLNKVEFVESFIATIITWTRSREDLDIDRLKEILIELERIRLDLEYKNYSLMQKFRA